MNVRPSGTPESFGSNNDASDLETLSGLVKKVARAIRDQVNDKSVKKMTSRDVEPTDKPPLQKIVDENIK